MSSDNQKIAVQEEGQQITEEEIGQYLHRRRWNQRTIVGSDWVYDLLSAAALDSAWDTQVVRLEQEVCVRDGACHSCHHFMSRMKEVGPTVEAVWYKEGYNTASCTAGANAGCALCGLIWDSLTPLGTFDLVQRIEQCLRRSVLRIAGTWSPDGRILIEIAIHCKGADPVMLTLRACEIQAVNGLDAAKSWLEACKSQHDCASRYTDLALPTRLIDLAQLRIIETASLNERPRYATLSYCWGRGSKIKLTEQTYEVFRSGMPEGDLPATIRDAVHVARQLGVQWLWVDALCIVQDQSEPVDWRAEAAIMGDIFGGGCINIAASTSADVYDGALQTPLAGFETSLLGGKKHVFLAHAWKMAVTDSVLARRDGLSKNGCLHPGHCT